jgi:Sulfotransferase domain
VALQVIGAGLARTGTTSLKLALEQLLARPCYHMLDVFENPHQIAVWHEAIRGNTPAWEVFDGYDAAVDLPASAFWRELTAANPEALIILSVRDTPEQWWDSVSATILDPSRPPPAPGTQMADYIAMATDLWEVRLGAGDMSDKKAMIAAYRRHNVRSTCPGAPGAASGMAAGRRLGPHRGPSWPAGARPAIPPGQHPRAVPRPCIWASTSGRVARDRATSAPRRVKGPTGH